MLSSPATVLSRLGKPRTIAVALVASAFATCAPVPARGAEREVTLAFDGPPCPRPEEVLADLDAVLVGTRARLVTSGADVTLASREDEVSVAAFGTTRTFSGSCAERARLVAAYVAMAIEPPEAPRPEAPRAVAPMPFSPPRPQPQPRVEGAPRPSTRLDVDARGGPLVFSGAGAGGGATGAFALRTTLGGATFGLAFGVTLGLPATVATRGPEVTISRLAVDLGLRATWSRGPLVLGAELGPVAARTTLSAPDLANAVPETARAELGLRGAADASLHLAGPLSAVVGVELYTVPSPARLALHDGTDVGHTPTLGALVLAGLRLRLLGPKP